MTMTGKISLLGLFALFLLPIGSCFGQSATTTRKVEPSIEFLQATNNNRLVLACFQPKGFGPNYGFETDLNLTYDEARKQVYAFRQCVNQFAPPVAYFNNPPTITSVELYGIVDKAAKDLTVKLADFICKGVWKSFNGSQQKDNNCSSPGELRPNLFFELLPAEGSSPIMVTLKIWGLSLELAAKKPDYWEFHRVSFQLPPLSLHLTHYDDNYILVASVFDSRLAKNRDNVRYITFDEVMPAQYDRDVSEFLDRILASLK
jgi:hypothetical protein